MKVNLDKKSLSILSILVGIVYLLMLYPTITRGIKGGLEGGLREYQKAHNRNDDNPNNDFDSKNFSLYLKLRDDKSNYYPDSVFNTQTQEMLPAQFEKMEVLYTNNHPKPLWEKIINALLTITLLPIIALLILILPSGK